MNKEEVEAFRELRAERVLLLSRKKEIVKRLKEVVAPGIKAFKEKKKAEVAARKVAKVETAIAPAGVV